MTAPDSTTPDSTTPVEPDTATPVADEVLAPDPSLPTTTEGTNLGEPAAEGSGSTPVPTSVEDGASGGGAVEAPVEGVPVSDPAAVPELDPSAIETKITSDEDPTLVNLDPTVDPTSTPLPGAPANEFEGLKDSLLNVVPPVEIDVVTVNVDIIESEEDTGEIFHEHSNYDTMVLNHPGGPYLTDVDNARNATLAAQRMAASEAATAAADETPNVTEPNSDVILESTTAPTS